jgi:lipid II:glycine glycyltransferase (peptidoglycan interpeptide bridge formation enzyme)
MATLNLEEQKQKMQEFATYASATLQEVSARTKESMDNVKSQMMAYANQIQEYLKSVNAEVDTYRFVVEKKGDGTSIDVAFKARVVMKE